MSERLFLEAVEFAPHLGGCGDGYETEDQAWQPFAEEELADAEQGAVDHHAAENPAPQIARQVVRGRISGARAAMGFQPVTCGRTLR